MIEDIDNQDILGQAWTVGMRFSPPFVYQDFIKLSSRKDCVEMPTFGGLPLNQVFASFYAIQDLVKPSLRLPSSRVPLVILPTLSVNLDTEAAGGLSGESMPKQACVTASAAAMLSSPGPGDTAVRGVSCNTLMTTLAPEAELIRALTSLSTVSNRE